MASLHQIVADQISPGNRIISSFGASEGQAAADLLPWHTGKNITAVILVCGLGFSDGLTFEAAGTSVTLTGLAIAAIAGVLLNVILPGNDYQFGKNLQGDINRGVAINPNPKKRQE